MLMTALYRNCLPVLSLALIVAPVLHAGEIILHPNGFGEHSYAAWKAQVGLPDSAGNSNQALYFQKMTATATFAAGVATFQGIEGTPTTALTGLEFWISIPDSHCGAGAPRFNIRAKPTAGGPSQTIFVGCAAMLPGSTLPAPSGKIYQQRSIAAPALAAMLPAGTITALSIVFDEGDDVGTGFAYLDNITVSINGTPMVWTSASDNGGQF